MKTEPDNLACEICSCPAVVHLLDQSSKKEHLFCSTHRPNLRPGQNRGLEIQRWRLAPDNPLSQKLATDENSPEHQSFRIEMCDMKVFCGGACLYYLSRLTNSDQFALWTDEFLDNMREYVVSQTEGAANCFPFDLDTVQFMTPFMKHKYYSGRTDAPAQTKQDRAVILLLHHPLWSDIQIAEHVPTTIKQLLRSADYTALRASRIKQHAT